MSRSSRPWMKVYETWFTSRSHVDMTDADLGRGLRMMSLANAAPDQGGEDQYCLRADGAPFPLAALARECRCSVGALRKTIGKFVAVETMVRRDDGAIGFPNFIRHQLSPSALRMRRYRDRHCDADDPPVDVTVSVTQDAEPIPKKRTRARGKRAEDRESASQTPPDPPRTPGLVAEDEALAWLRDRLPYARRPQGTNALPVLDAKLRELLRAGFGAEQILAGTESFAEAIDAGRAKRADWRGTYVFSVGWFERILAEHSSIPEPEPVVDPAEAIAHERRTGSLPPPWRRVPHGLMGPGGKLHPFEDGEEATC